MHLYISADTMEVRGGGPVPESYRWLYADAEN